MVVKKEFLKDVKMVVKMVRLSVAVLVFLLEYQMVVLMEFSKVVKMVDLTAAWKVFEMAVLKVEKWGYIYCVKNRAQSCTLDFSRF